MTIRGLAGPFAVMGQNFAPGTTAADVESAMTPVGGEMVSCEVVKTQPFMIVEMVFASREGGERVIETFNNKTVRPRPLLLFTFVFLVINNYTSRPMAESSRSTPSPGATNQAATQHQDVNRRHTATRSSTAPWASPTTTSWTRRTCPPRPGATDCTTTAARTTPPTSAVAGSRRAPTTTDDRVVRRRGSTGGGDLYHIENPSLL